MKQRIQTVAGCVATIAALAGAITLTLQATDGLRSFTSESWRRAQVARDPLPLPEAQLQDHQGVQFALSDLCGRVLVVNFIYTQCASICRALGSESAQLASKLRPLIENNAVAVISISFDPQRDGPEQMSAYKRSMERGATSWRIARPRQEEDNKRLLETFGVVVIPDSFGGFDHNAALHIVDRSCRLVRILDINDVDAAASLVQSLT